MSTTPAPKLFYSVADLKAAGIGGRSKIYQLFRSGALKAVVNGGATGVTAAELERYLSELPERY